MWRFLAQDAMQTRLHRWRMNLVTWAASEQDLSDSCTEFGTINSGFGGRPYRYNHAATNEPGWFLFNGLVKHDTLTGREERYQFEPGVFCSEVGVAPRVGGTGEDDAYLVTLTVHMNRDLSECVVFRASDVGHGPIARARCRRCTTPSAARSSARSCTAGPAASAGIRDVRGTFGPSGGFERSVPRATTRRRSAGGSPGPGLVPQTIERPATLLTHTTCGGEFRPVLHCSSCTREPHGSQIQVGGDPPKSRS